MQKKLVNIFLALWKVSGQERETECKKEIAAKAKDPSNQTTLLSPSPVTRRFSSSERYQVNSICPTAAVADHVLVCFSYLQILSEGNEVEKVSGKSKKS